MTNAAAGVFATQQMASVFDYGMYKQMVGTVSSSAADVAFVRDWQVRGNTKVRELPAGPVRVFIDDATMSVGTLAATCMQCCIDTTNPVFWFMVEDALCAAARLVCLPDAKLMSDQKVDDLVRACATVCDMLFRLSDNKLRDAAVMIDDDAVMQARFAHIYMDIICGRVAAWIFYSRLMALEACTIRNMDFHKTRNDYFTARFDSLGNKLKELLNTNDEGALGSLSVLLGTFVTIYVRVANHVFSADTHGQREFSDAMIGNCMREGAGSLMAAMTANGMMNTARVCGGYWRLFDTNMVDGVIALPDKVASVMYACFEAHVRQNME